MGEREKTLTISLPSIRHVVEELLKADAFTVSVRGFAAIEATLDQLLSEALPIQESLELERLTAALKADLAVGLGLVPVDDAPALRRLARVRNLFAHEFDATFDKTAQRDLLNTLSATQRSSVDDMELGSLPPVEALRWVTFTVFAGLLRCVHQRRETQVQTEVWNEILHEKAEELRRTMGDGEKREWPHDIQAREKLAAKRRERGWELKDEDSGA